MGRILLSLFLCLTLAPSLWAEQKTLRFWQFWPQDWIRPEISRFEAEHNTKVIIERLTWADGLNKIITALAADQAPDVIEIGSTWVAGFAEGGGLLPMADAELWQNLNLLKPGLFQGRQFALPWTLSTGALFYNKKLLQAAGVNDLPQDWNQLLAASAKLHALGPKIYGYGLKTGSYSTWQKFLPLAWSNGASLLSPDLSQPALTSPAFVEAVEFYQKLGQVGLYDDNLVIRKAFQEGRVGFMLDEPGQLAIFAKESPDLDFGIMPLPPSPSTGKSMGFAGGQMLAITKNAKDPQLASELVKFLVQPAATQALTKRITTLFPAYKGAAQDAFYQKEHPELLVFLKILDQATSPPAHPQWVEIQEIFSEELDRVMYGKAPAAQAMQQADQRLRRLLAGAGQLQGDPAQAHKILAGLKILGWLALGGGGIWLLVQLIKQRNLPAEQQAKAGRAWRYHQNTLLFLAPWILVFVTFSLFPIGYSLFLSFTHFKATGAAVPAWVGLGNYQSLLQDPYFLKSLWNSFVFVFFTVPPIMVLAVLLAVLLNQRLKGRTFYRVSYFMPVVTSVLVIATLFLELYSPAGIINDLLGLVGLPGKHWLKDPDWAMISIMIMSVWSSFGFYTLMLLAGLQNIPEEYYEASALEGAGKLRQFFTITLPLLKPTLLVATLMDCILAFQVFGEVLIMTKGGPLRSTETSVYYLYETAFHKQQMGYGSAAAYIIFVILVVFSLTQFKLSQDKRKKARLP